MAPGKPLLSPAAPAGVSVCIVAYNALDKLRACLDSLHAQQSPRVIDTIVLDNASAEPVADTVRADYPWVRLMPNAENLGFAGGTNLAVAAATQPLRLLLNPDTVLPTPDTIEKLAACFERVDRLGALGCRLELPDGATQVIAGRRPRAAALVLDLLHIRLTPPPAPVRDGLLEAEYICGAALLTSAEVWEDVGPLDEGYFMYFEDVDWCRRAARAGYRLAATPDVTIIHHEGATYGGRTFVRRMHFWRALVRYLRRNDGRIAVGLVRLALALGGLIKLPWAWLADRSPERAARLELLRLQLRLGLRGA
jgi:GT2 family glycosyltransferase